MTTAQRRKLIAELRRAHKVGAPFTTPRHPFHTAMRELERAAIVTGRRVGRRTFWSEVER